MGKTSVYLNRELTAEWKASGLPLAEVVRRGLHAPDLEDTLRRVIRDELGTMPATGSTRGTDSTAPPPPLAAMPTQADDEPGYGTVSCRHPAQSIRDDGTCGECGTELDPA